METQGRAPRKVKIQLHNYTIYEIVHFQPVDAKYIKT
jgi:hypothetical protein